MPRLTGFRWSLHSTTANKDIFSLYAVNYDSHGTRYLAGDFVEHATLDKDNATGKPAIALQFTSLGSKEFYLMTHRNIDKELAIIIDGRVAAAPKVISEIKNGRCTITGGDENDLHDLEYILSAGNVNVPFKTQIFVH